MLNTAGKLLERLLKPRSVAGIQNAGALFESQHGHREGRPSVGAIEYVVKIVRETQQENY